MANLRAILVAFLQEVDGEPHGGRIGMVGRFGESGRIDEEMSEMSQTLPTIPEELKEQLQKQTTMQP